MTPQDHNKVIGIMLLIWGGMNALTMLILVPFFLIAIGAIGSDPSAPPELTAILGAFGVFFFLLALLFGVPPVVAGYGMLKRKSWARVMGIISACLTALSFPLGTALCVYSMWFLFGEGEKFYRGYDAPPAPAPDYLRDASSYEWNARRANEVRREQPRDYVPPTQPPDWRG